MSLPSFTKTGKELRFRTSKIYFLKKNKQRLCQMDRRFKSVCFPTHSSPFFFSLIDEPMMYFFRAKDHWKIKAVSFYGLRRMIIKLVAVLVNWKT
jgi:hypothetical protein